MTDTDIDTIKERIAIEVEHLPEPDAQNEDHRRLAEKALEILYGTRPTDMSGMPAARV